MRIVLIKTACFLKSDPSISPPVGLMYLASVLKGAGHEVKVFDSRLYKGRVLEMTAQVEKFQPEVIGFSSFSTEVKALWELGKFLRRRFPNAVFIAGGPHPTAVPEMVLRDQKVDVVVRGEGEKTVVELLNSLKEGRALQTVKGIVFQKNGDIFATERREFIEDLDSIPYPDWDSVELSKYWKLPRFTGTTGKYMPIITSRGCPYQCVYCHSLFGKKFRVRKPEKIMEEIETIVSKFGVRDFEVIDDIFNLDAERAKKMLNLIIGRKRDLKIKLSFPNGIRLDLADYELLWLMKEAGTYYLAVPVETGSLRIQEKVGKKLNLEKAREVIEWADKLGIFTRGYFMIGFPGETRQEINLTIDFAKNSRLKSASFLGVTPLPGSKLFQECLAGVQEKKFGFIDLNYFDNLANLSAESDEVLFRLHAKASKEFYSFKRIVSFVIHFPSKKSLLRGLLLYLKHIFGRKEIKKIPGAC